MHAVKNLFFIALASIASVASYAQPNSILVYGNVGYGSQGGSGSVIDPNNPTKSFSINPGVGYQFNQHLTVGVQGGYNYAENTNATVNYPFNLSNYNGSYSKVNAWSAGAFFRYTCPLSKVFFFYTQLNASYLSEKDNYSEYSFILGTGSVPVFYTNPEVNSNGFQVSLFPAIGVNIWKGLALNCSIGGVNYTSLARDGEFGSSPVNSNEVHITVGQEVNIGISKNFNTGMHHRHKAMADGEDDDAPKMHHKKHHKSDDAADDTAPKHKKHHDDDDE